ncbi:HNH endonuclease [Thiothrix sp.]|uniref:HNH endonuclease n=1 Tax=Thiothrix sp. TaxID=1032 RepID=UPI0034444855
MAHPNINERQSHVKSLLIRGVDITTAIKKELAAIYSCSTSAIHADIIWFTKPHSKHSIYTSSAVRKIVHARDGEICQYCGSETAYEYIVEHVIPAAIGGDARPYNLVIACQSCNIRKGRKVWIPRNLIEITEYHKDWRERVLSLADDTSPNLSVVIELGATGV